jgi:protocatechuate 3,4-dioxygenase beta subunit
MDGIGVGTAEPPLAQLGRRIDAAGVTRLGAGPLAAARALHDVVGQLRPTGEELRASLDFLTEVGQAPDEQRQEWVLLADVIGVSTLVEDLNAPRPAGATQQTMPGPFYRADAPELPDGADLSRDGRGERLAIRGQVRALRGQPVAGASVEIWQPDGEGLQEDQDPDRQPEFNLRGRLRADAEGRFACLSVKPGPTRLPDDGPVGRLMAALGLGTDRPAHVLFRVTAPGFRPLVTHVFDREDPLVGRDPLFGVRPELLFPFRAPAKDRDGPPFRLDVTLTLCPDGGEP